MKAVLVRAAAARVSLSLKCLVLLFLGEGDFAKRPVPVLRLHAPRVGEASLLRRQVVERRSHPV